MEIVGFKSDWMVWAAKNCLNWKKPIWRNTAARRKASDWIRNWRSNAKPPGYTFKTILHNLYFNDCVFEMISIKRFARLSYKKLWREPEWSRKSMPGTVPNPKWRTSPKKRRKKGRQVRSDKNLFRRRKSKRGSRKSKPNRHWIWIAV